MKPKVNRCTYL